MTKPTSITRIFAVAVGASLLLALLDYSRVDTKSSVPQILEVRVQRDGAIEAEGHRFQDAKDFEVFLRERRPKIVHVIPATDASYVSVNGAMKAIQNVGNIDIGLVGNEKF